MSTAVLLLLIGLWVLANAFNGNFSEWFQGKIHFDFQGTTPTGSTQNSAGSTSQGP